MQIDLARFVDLGTGHETPLLPAQRFRVRERGVRFPVTTPALTPIEPHPMDLDMPRASLFHFGQATVHGYRLLEIAGRAAHDGSLANDRPQKFPARPELRMFEEVALDGPRPLSRSGITVTEPVRGAVFCGVHEISNFGSWLFRALPKLLLARKHAPGRPVMISQRTAWMRAITRLAYPEAEVIDHQADRSYHLEDVVVPSLATPEAYVRPELQAMFTELVASLPKVPGSPERIYLSRRGQQTRVLENEAELVDRLADRGFVEFFPERHTIEHQLAVISQARVIVCPGGSGLFGTLFARQAEMLIDLEANQEWVHAHRNVLDASGRPFSMAQGAQFTEDKTHLGPHRNWIVDVDGTVLGLKHLGIT
jgi:hypothetical protein